MQRHHRLRVQLRGNGRAEEINRYAWVPRALGSQGLLDSQWARSLGRRWTYAPALTQGVFTELRVTSERS